MIKFTEEALWELLQFVTFNLKALNDVNESLEFLLEKNKQLIYLVDFSDIHPIMYPERSKEYYDSDMPMHGQSVRVLWENIINLGELREEFKFTLSPGARLEVFESLRHCKCRVEREVSKHIPQKVLMGSFDDIFQFIMKAGFKEKDIVNSLKKFVDDKSIEEGVKKPAYKIIELYSKGILSSLEDVLPEAMISDVTKKTVNPQVKDELVKFFDLNPRRYNLSHDEMRHDKFHDAVDVFNLALTYELIELSKEKYTTIYTPFITHTERVVAAGKKIDNVNLPTIVQRSVAPLYIATGIKTVGKSKLKNYFNFALSTIASINDELFTIARLHELKKLGKTRRDNYFSQNKTFLNVPSRIVRLLEAYCNEIYGKVDQTFFFQDYIQQQEENKVGNVDNLKELITKLKRVQNASKEAALEVKKTIGGNFESGLSDLYSPNCSYAKDITDWINS